MRSYEAIVADATPAAPFYSGTDGEVWYDRWCGRCRNDPVDPDEQALHGCPIWTAMLCEGVTPREMTQPPDGGWVCSQFDERREGEPDPVPEPEPDPAQDSLDGLIELYAADLRTEVAVS